MPRDSVRAPRGDAAQVLVETLNAILSGFATTVFVPVAVLAIEVVGSFLSRSVATSVPGTRATVAILIPAHNEEGGIAETLRSIVPQLTHFDRLLVVADNCTDGTGSIAVSAGGEVVFRNDIEKRGKGFALDFGIQHLRGDPPDIVIVVDADCEVKSGAIDRLARICAKYKRPVQARYLMRNLGHARLKLQVAEFAWTVKNLVRPLGLAKLGLPCQLMGSGMAFPWATISTLDLASAHIVEDMKTGLDLTRNGTAPMFCPEAVVLSAFPTNEEGIKDQRTRWEHGHLGILLSDAPRALIQGILRMDFSMVAIALDLCVPPLALLVMLIVVLWLGALIFLLATGLITPLLIASSDALIFGLSVITAWASYGRQIISLPSLLSAVLYPICKLPMYARFVFSRQSAWVRAKRDKDR